MKNSSTEKIEIRDNKKIYLRRLESFRKDDSINAENKQVILDFLRGCEIGKLSKKQCSPARLSKYIYLFSRLNSMFNNKPFKEITGKEIEDVIINLNNGFYKKQRVILKRNSGGKQLVKIPTEIPLSNDTVNDFKIIIKRLIKFIYGEGDNYQELAGWIRNDEKLKEVPALTREEIEQLVNASSSRDRAIMLVLFDSGARIEEFLNIRIGDLTRKHDNGRSYYQVRIKHSKTKPRTISIPMCTEVVDLWLSIHPNNNDPQAQLFPLTYDAIRVFLNRLGRKVLKKNIYPHLFRHSSATYYCNRLNQYQLCYRYGWSMTSKQHQRYIDREGINEEKTAETVHFDDMSKLKQENQKLRESLSMVKSEQDKIMKDMERRNQLDPLLNKIFANKKIVEMLAKELGFKND